MLCSAGWKLTCGPCSCVGASPLRCFASSVDVAEARLGERAQARTAAVGNQKTRGIEEGGGGRGWNGAEGGLRLSRLTRKQMLMLSIGDRLLSPMACVNTIPVLSYRGRDTIPLRSTAYTGIKGFTDTSMIIPIIPDTRLYSKAWCTYASRCCGGVLGADGLEG